MNTRLASRLLALALAVTVGCASQNDKKIALQIEPKPPQEEAAGQEPVAKNEASAADLTVPTAPAGNTPADANLLAKKAEAYAHAVESAMAKRSTSKPSAVPGSSGSPKDSVVQWLDPHEFRIGAPDSEANPAHKATPTPGEAPKIAMVPPAGPAPKVESKPWPGIETSLAQANSGVSLDAPRIGDAAAAKSEPSADKASAIMSPVDSFESRFTKRLKDNPRDVSANLDYQLMLFLRDEPVPQLTAISSLPAEDRELVSAVMDALSNFRATLRSDNNMLLSRKIRPITELAERLRTQAELSIPTLVLCTKVEGFGRYEPIDPPRFGAQKEANAVIYCELENFSSVQNDAKLWQTDVTQEAVLYTEDGMQVWADKTQKVTDLSRNKRHDFFLRTVVKFPATLTVGRYMLKVTIIDTHANRVAESSLPIQITAQ